MTHHLILSQNRLTWKGEEFPFSIGLNGLTHDKVEGDKSTPIGEFPFRQVFFRPDRIDHVTTSLPLKALTPQCGWCDDPKDPLYNQYVTRPFSSRHEDLWREDHIYDLILVVGHNDAPPIKGKGSAIFVHLRRLNGAGTYGCVALEKENLLNVLRECTHNSHLIVNP